MEAFTGVRGTFRSPWRVDCILNPIRDGRWIARLDSDG